MPYPSNWKELKRRMEEMSKPMRVRMVRPGEAGSLDPSSGIPVGTPGVVEDRITGELRGEAVDIMRVLFEGYHRSILVDADQVREVITQTNAAPLTVASLGHPANRILVQKDLDGVWRRLHMGSPVDTEDFRGGWHEWKPEMD